jgi:hypothetical protein
MASTQISTLIVMLLSYLTVYTLAADNQVQPFFQSQTNHVTCLTPSNNYYGRLLGGPLPEDWRASPEDCRAAINIIPSGRLTFEGGVPPTWSIEPPAQRRKGFPAAFGYRTCTITVLSYSNTPLPRSVDSVARTMYYHVWPAAREGAERVLQRCTRGAGTGGFTGQSLKFNGDGPYELIVYVESSAIANPSCRVYDAETGAETVQVTPKKKRPWFKGCLGCSATVE